MDLDEQLILTDKVIVPAFSSQIIKVRTKKTYMIGHRLNIMMQPPYPEDKANLPVGLYIQRVYSDLKDGGQNLSTVVRNGTAKPIHLASGQIVGWVVATNAVPDAIVSPELEEKLAKEDGEKPMPMTVEQRQELLMRVLTENGSIGKLDGPEWSPQTALKAKCLLMQFHHVFSLEPKEIYNKSFETEYFTLGGCAGPERPIATIRALRQNILLWEGVLVLKGQYIEQARITVLRQNISLWEGVLVLKGQ